MVTQPQRVSFFVDDLPEGGGAPEGNHADRLAARTCMYDYNGTQRPNAGDRAGAPDRFGDADSAVLHGWSHQPAHARWPVVCLHPQQKLQRRDPVHGDVQRRRIRGNCYRLEMSAPSQVMYALWAHKTIERELG